MVFKKIFRMMEGLLKTLRKEDDMSFRRVLTHAVAHEGIPVF